MKGEGVRETDAEVLVLGAGITGLAAALELERCGREVCLIDAADAPGGVMRSDRIGGFQIERGPNTIQLKPPIRSLFAVQGLEAALTRASPESSRRCLYRGGKLIPVPMNPISLVSSPLLSARAKWRLLAEPFLKSGDPTGESVSEFVGRRLGAEVVSSLIGPFLTGVYAGDEEQLGAESVFPGLVALERQSGSIVRGGLSPARLIASRRGPRGLRGIWSTEEGLGGLAAGLASRLSRTPRFSSRARSVRREGGHWCIGLESSAGEEEFRASRLVLATPALEAAELLESVCGEAAEILRSIDYAPVVSVAVGVKRGEHSEPIEGFGFLVPREAKMSLLGCLYMSRLFPGRAPEGRELLQCMVGGTRWRAAIECPEDELAKRLHIDLDKALGLRSEPELLAVRRWPRAVPQPGRRHREQTSALRRAIADQPGLQLAGAYLDGVSVADAAACGLRTAQEISSSS